MFGIIDSYLATIAIFLYKVLNNYFDLDLYSQLPILQLLLLGGISSNCLRIVQGCCVDQITFLTESLTIGTVYQISYVVNSTL